MLLVKCPVKYYGYFEKDDFASAAKYSTVRFLLAIQELGRESFSQPTVNNTILSRTVAKELCVETPYKSRIKLIKTNFQNLKSHLRKRGKPKKSYVTSLKIFFKLIVL